MYQFTTNDGKIGEGISTFSAMADALGGDRRADEMIDNADGTFDLEWSHLSHWKYRAQADLVARGDGSKLGTFKMLWDV